MERVAFPREQFSGAVLTAAIDKALASKVNQGGGLLLRRLGFDRRLTARGASALFGHSAPGQDATESIRFAISLVVPMNNGRQPRRA